MGWLVSYSRNSAGVDFQLREGKNWIGSDPERCDIVLTGDATVSGEHTVILCRAGQFFIKDNGSTNGTFVNGVDILGQPEVALVNGARVRVGTMDLIFTQVATEV